MAYTLGILVAANLTTQQRTNYRGKKTREESLTITTGACASRKSVGLHVEDPRLVKLGVSVNGPIGISTMIIQNSPGNMQGHLITPLPSVAT